MNPALGLVREGSSPALVIHKVKAAELDEMWSFVGSKKQPWWLWEALDHQTGRIVAYTFGRRADRVLVKLKALLEPFGIRRFYTDGWGAYHRHLNQTMQHSNTQAASCESAARELSAVLRASTAVDPSGV